MPDLLTPVPSASLAADWSAALAHILAAPQRIRVFYQPIVDLSSGGVRGFEALARFPEAPEVPPRDWFLAAAQLGCGGALEAQVLEAALVSRPLLHRRRFVAVNLSPAALLSPEVTRTLAGDSSLEGIVVELVGNDDGADLEAVRVVLDRMRARGAAVSVDGLGGGNEDLGRLGALRPEFVKLDGASVAAQPGAAAAAVFLESYLLLAHKLDAWLVVKGLETMEQLDLVVRASVPLGQGFALGRPAPAMAELPRELTARIRRHDGAALTTLAPLVERIPLAAMDPAEIGLTFRRNLEATHVLVVSAAGQPTGIADRAAHGRGEAPRPVLLVPAGASLKQAAQQAVARPQETRLDPLVCVDGQGLLQGVVPIDRLLSALAR